jgi:hypothetical protein
VEGRDLLRDGGFEPQLLEPTDATLMHRAMQFPDCANPVGK